MENEELLPIGPLKTLFSNHVGHTIRKLFKQTNLAFMYP